MDFGSIVLYKHSLPTIVMYSVVCIVQSDRDLYI